MKRGLQDSKHGVSCWDSQHPYPQQAYRRAGNMGKLKMMCKSGDQGLMGIEGRASNLNVESRKIFQEEATAKLQLYRNECLEEEQHLQRRNL